MTHLRDLGYRSASLLREKTSEEGRVVASSITGEVSDVQIRIV